MSVDGVLPNKSSFLLCSGGVFIHKTEVPGQFPAAWGVFELVGRCSFWGPTQDEPSTEPGSPQGPSIEWRRAEGSLSER